MVSISTQKLAVVFFKSWVSALVVLVGKNPPAVAGDLRDMGSIPGLEDPLETGMTSHSSIFAWRIPRIEEPGGLQSTRSQRVGHD